MGWLLSACKCTFSFVASFLLLEIGESLASCRSRWRYSASLLGSDVNLKPRGCISSYLTEEWVTIDEKKQRNPLLDFQIPVAIGSSPGGLVNEYYIKEANYATVWYPLSGISNPESAKRIADLHNEKIHLMNESPADLLKRNLLAWLNLGRVENGKIKPNSIHRQYSECFTTLDYNKFSNTISSNLDKEFYESLEQPHNNIHLAVGGFTTPELDEDSSVKVDQDGKYKYFGLLEGANGDMGANEVASFDPIFFLHHCNIDRMF